MLQAPLREELRAVPRPALEEYVGLRIKQFTRVFAGHLLPGVTEQSYEYAYAKALQTLGSVPQEQRSSDTYLLKFRHKCRFLGCTHKECQLCKNNPNKRCGDDDNFDECFADGQILKSKCESDVYLELINSRTGAAEPVSGLEFVVSVVDGESYSESAAGNMSHIKELLKNDDGSVLLGAYQAGSKADQDGRLYLKMQEGQPQVKLPDVCVTDKNDTFHLNNETFSSFRLMAKAVRRDVYGKPVPVEGVVASVSGKFIVKTQRALNDYRKSDYPHYKDELTKLKHIGSITAQRLREIQQHLDCPYTCVETVEQLKMLVQYADQNRQVENKMLELLNMKGKHKHKWDYLRDVLSERVVYDDMLHRVWYTDESRSQGVLFSCKQGQVNLERPLGLVQRASTGRLLVSTSPMGQDNELLKQWRAMAEASWYSAGHRGWSVLQEQLEMVNAGAGGSSLLIGGSGALNMAPSMSMGGDGMDDQLLARRGSVASMGAPMMLGEAQSAKSRRSSVSYANAQSPEISAQGLYMQPSGSGALEGMGSQQLMQAGGQPAFQFTGRQSITQPNMLNPDLVSDVYRTSSAPNMAHTMSPVYGRNSGDYQSPENTGPLPPQPARSSRFRRMSADASAVRQIAMMQAAGMPPPQDALNDMSGKRGRNSAPGHTDDPPPVVDPQNPASRHMLYHFESRGRHTPRSRLSAEMSDSVVAAALGNMLETSDIESYLAQNFSFLTGGPDQDGAAMAAMAPTSGNGLQGQPFMGLHPEQLTGQMQQTLILNDAHSVGSTQPGMSGMDPLQHLGAAQRDLHHQAQDTEQVLVPNNRKLQHCESDSFKRFLAVGLPFSPLDPTPEALFEGDMHMLRGDSGLMD